MPAELTSTRTGPMLLAISTALTMSSVLVTSTLQKAPPISFANSEPLSSCKSATTTLAPFEANNRADAAPIPDAPPVTIALTPLISIGGDDNAVALVGVIHRRASPAVPGPRRWALLPRATETDLWTRQPPSRRRDRSSGRRSAP